MPLTHVSSASISFLSSAGPGTGERAASGGYHAIGAIAGGVPAGVRARGAGPDTADPGCRAFRPRGSLSSAPAGRTRPDGALTPAAGPPSRPRPRERAVSTATGAPRRPGPRPGRTYIGWRYAMVHPDPGPPPRRPPPPRRARGHCPRPPHCPRRRTRSSTPGCGTCGRPS